MTDTDNSEKKQLPIIKTFFFHLNNYKLVYFFNPILKKDNIIATNTSSIGEALGTPKFHKITPNSQIKYIFII